MEETPNLENFFSLNYQNAKILLGVSSSRNLNSSKRFRSGKKTIFGIPCFVFEHSFLFPIVRYPIEISIKNITAHVS